MANGNTKNFVDFLVSTKGETEEEIKNYLKEAGIEPEDAKEKVLKELKKRKAEIRKEIGKKKQQEFNKEIKTEIFRVEIVNNNMNIFAMQYREEGEISEEEKKMIEDRDKRRMEILKSIDGKGDE